MKPAETLDTDVARLPLKAMPAPRTRRFKVQGRSMRLRSGIDPARLNQLVDDIEAEAAGMSMRVRIKRLEEA